MLYNWDAVQFALALREFDVAKHQPHPPGYLLYVGLGRLLNASLGDPTPRLRRARHALQRRLHLRPSTALARAALRPRHRARRRRRCWRSARSSGSTARWASPMPARRSPRRWSPGSPTRARRQRAASLLGRAGLGPRRRHAAVGAAPAPPALARLRAARVSARGAAWRWRAAILVGVRARLARADGLAERRSRRLPGRLDAALRLGGLPDLGARRLARGHARPGRATCSSPPWSGSARSAWSALRAARVRAPRGLGRAASGSSSRGCVPPGIFYTLVHFGQAGYVLTFLPALVILLSRVLVVGGRGGLRAAAPAQLALGAHRRRGAAARARSTPASSSARVRCRASSSTGRAAIRGSGGRGTSSTTGS